MVAPGPGPESSGGDGDGGGEGRILFSYNFRENIMLDATFFDAADELFGDPTQHTVEGELEDELWLYEYRRRRSEVEED